MKLIINISLLFFSITTFSQVDSLTYYFQNGDYRKAISFGEKAKKDNTIKLHDLGIVLNYLATSYSKVDDYENATLNFLDELKIELQLFGENHRIIANTYRNLGNNYTVSKEYNEAEKCFVKAIEIKKNTDGISHPEYGSLILDLATLYKEKKEYKNAEIWYLKGCEIRKTCLGENHYLYHRALLSTAIFYEKKGDLQKSEDFFLKSYELQKLNLKGETLMSFIFINDLLGKRYSSYFNYYEAEKFYLESLNLKKKYLGIESEEYIDSLFDLVMLYSNIDNKREKKKEILQEASNLLSFTGKEISNQNAEIEKATANTYHLEANYELAESHYLKLCKIETSLNGKNSIQYSNSLMLLSNNYLKKGDMQKTEELIQECLNILKLLDNQYEYLDKLLFSLDFYLKINSIKKYYDLLIEADSTYNKIKNKLPINDLMHYQIQRSWLGYYLKIGDFENALEKALLKVEITKNNPISKNNANFISTDIQDLALVYEKMSNYDKAEIQYSKAYEIRSDIIGENLVNDIRLLGSLARINSKKNKIAAANKYYDKVINISKESFQSKEVLKNSFVILEMIAFYINNNEISKSIFYSQEIINELQFDLLKKSDFLSTDEYKNYIFDNIEKVYLTNTLLDLVFLKNPELNASIYENGLLLKNLSLRNQQRIRTSIERNGNEAVKEKYKQFIDNKRFIVKLEELPINERPSNYEQLKTDTESLEKELTRLSSSFADAQKSLSITWNQIQEQLKPNEVAIDIVSYHYYNKKWTDSIMYGAFIIKKDSKFPKYFRLFEEKQLSNLMDRNSSNEEYNLSKKIDELYNNNVLGNLFYKPLEKELENIETIYWSPSGLTHQLNIKALPTQNQLLFGEKFDIKLTASNVSILNYNSKNFNEIKDLEIILYGGIDYNKKSVIEKDVSKNQFNDLVLRSGISGFAYLKGTHEEVQKIQNQANKQNYKTLLKTEREATEESIKQLDGKKEPFILHLATHGYFFENIKNDSNDKIEFLIDDTKQKTIAISEDPMIRSGLIFAGANQFWGKNKTSSTSEDGILTAKEISNLDLSACELVVLSACETGLGQINGSDGVFGLQRAFKMAGAKNIIMSLWKVPDAHTAELFEIFYQECFRGVSVPKALQLAQNQMKTKYSPFYWAGFVLLE